MPLANILKQARGHPAPEDHIQQGGRVTPFVCQRVGRHAQHDVNLLQLLFVALLDARMRIGRRGVWRVCGARRAVKFARDEIHEARMLEIPRRGDHHAVWRVPLLETFGHRVLRKL